MRIETTTGVQGPILPAAAVNFFGRLKQLAQETHAQIAADAAPPEEMLGGETTVLTQSMLRNALMEIGAPPDPKNMEIANALTRLGLPLTSKMLTEAHLALSAAPEAAALSFALAKTLALPTTPAALQALTAVINGIPADRALPVDIQAWIGLALDAGMKPEALAAHLNLAVNQLARSTERRIAKAMAKNEEIGNVRDLRTLLLNLMQATTDKTVRRGADALAAHEEGQQLLNQASLRAHDTRNATPLYFAIPVHFSEEQTMLEMRLRTWDQTEDEEDSPDDTAYLRAEIRIATSRLGRVQAEIVGTVERSLTCRVSVEKPAANRLVQRHSGSLAASLAALGWRVQEITCRQTDHWPPLWFGGEGLNAPRTRVDWRA